MDRTTALWSRSSAAASASGEGAISRTIRITSEFRLYCRTKPASANTREHLVVLGQRVGDEPPNAVVPGILGEMLEHDRADAVPLMDVVDEERHLGFVLTRVPVSTARWQ